MACCRLPVASCNDRTIHCYIIYIVVVVGLVVVVVMLPVDTTMAVMCHVLFCLLSMHVHGSGCRCDYCMFFRSVDTRRRPVMLMMSHYELHDDELAWWHSSLSESHRIARVRHELIAAMRFDQLRCLASALWRCLIVLKCFE